MNHDQQPKARHKREDKHVEFKNVELHKLPRLPGEKPREDGREAFDELLDKAAKPKE